MDARRTANERSDQKIIRGPLKIYDTAPALIGGLFAEKHGRLVEYSRRVYELFFKRELAVDEVDAVEIFIGEFGLSAKDYRAYFEGDGQREYEDAQKKESQGDQIFGVPICVFRGEQFLGQRPRADAGRAARAGRAVVLSREKKSAVTAGEGLGHDRSLFRADAERLEDIDHARGMRAALHDRFP